MTVRAKFKVTMIELHIQNAEAVNRFELGAEYYVDFTKAEGDVS